jgi:hypothetical protein
MSHLKASHCLLARITSTCSDQHGCQMWHVSATRRQTLPVLSSNLYCAVWYRWVRLITLPLYSWGRNPQFSFSRDLGVPRASVGGKKVSLLFIDSSTHPCTFVEASESSVQSFHFLPEFNCYPMHLTLLYNIRHSLCYSYCLMKWKCSYSITFS